MTLGARRVAGLDIGQTSTKLVVVEAARGGVRVVKTAVFRNREEGLLDVAEVRGHLATWLREQGVADASFSLGLPQYLAMTNIVDFPPSGTAKLEEMVAFETQQLAGLTDEIFIDDYRLLRAFHHYRNPVLVGVAREALIEQRLELLRRAEVRVDHLFLEGEVLASVFARTRAAAAAKGPALLLDVGAENTTMTIVLDGQPLYLGSLPFGGDFFSEALARHLGTSELDAEKVKRTARIEAADEAAPLTRAVRSFVVELEAALDTWRSHDPEAGKLRIEAIHLSGGGARLAGFREFIAQTYHCPVETLAVPDLVAAQGEDAPVFNIAYGLACHGLDGAQRPAVLSLLPPAVRWQAMRRERLPALYVALVLLVLLCAAYFALTIFALDREWASLTAQRERLERCKEVVPELVTAQAAIESVQRMLQPFAGRGNRGRRLVEAVDQLSQAKQPGDWIYFMADYPGAYRNVPDPFQAAGAVARPPSPFLWAGAKPAASGGADDQVTVLAQSTVPWTGLAVSGFTPQKAREEVQSVKEMIRRLNESKLFAHVDGNPRPSPADAQAQRPWLPFHMRPFALLCPFEEVEFELPRAEGKPK